MHPLRPNFSFPGTSFPPCLTQQSDRPNLHAPIHRLAHIVNSQTRHRSSRQSLHLDARLVAAADGARRGIVLQREAEDKAAEEIIEEKVVLPESESLTMSLGSLLKGIKL